MKATVHSYHLVLYELIFLFQWWCNVGNDKCWFFLVSDKSYYLWLWWLWLELYVCLLRSNLVQKISLMIYSPPFYGMFWTIVATSKHEHWPPFIVRCLNSNCGLTIAWILTREGDSEDNECSCYDVTPRDGAERQLLPGVVYSSHANNKH
jgi:hypothetical protein